jgi:hypothetical protein
MSSLCLIIKGLDNQDQKLNYQINEYPKKGLIVILGQNLIDLIMRIMITSDETNQRKDLGVIGTRPDPHHVPQRT